MGNLTVAIDLCRFYEKEHSDQTIIKKKDFARFCFCKLIKL